MTKNRDLSHSSRTRKSGSRGTRRTLREKLAIAAGGGTFAAAIVGAPSTADAVLVMAMNTPITPPAGNGTSNNWDVDGDASPDFVLIGWSFAGGAYIEATMGGELVIPAGRSNGLSKLPANAAVGAGLPAAYKFAAAYAPMTYYGYVASYATAGGWAASTPQTGFFGFSFTNGTGTHFGWGEMTITGSPLGRGFTINEAYYETTANTAVMAGVAIPEASQIASLSLLSLGAAGLAMWRRRNSVSVAI